MARRRKTHKKLLGGCLGILAILLVIGCIAAAVSDSDGDAAQDGDDQPAASSQAAASSDASAAASEAAGDPGPAPATAGDLIVRFVDVGQGDATVLEFPDGKTMVIDAGEDGAAAVNAQLSADGRSAIDWLVATHPDADHIGGLPGVINANDVRSVWAPNVSHDTATYTRFLQAVADKGLQIDAAQAGKQVATGGGYSIDLVWPPADADYEDTNAYSAVVLVTYGSTKLLFTGDAPAEALERAAVGHVDVLKVSHHGSASGTNAEVARELSPSIAVISYGLGNDYGHPTQLVLDVLGNVGTAIYGTGANGTVTVTSDGTSVAASVEREGTVVAESDHAGAGSQSLEASSSGSGGPDTGSGSGGATAKPSAQESQATPQVSGDTSDADTVYVTPSGKKYHRWGCKTLSDSSHLTAMTRSEAEAAGYEACKVCGG